MENANTPTPTRILHIRADRSSMDFYNNFTLPVRELFEYRELIRNIISRDLKKRYKRSFLGVLWTILAPLLTMLVMWAVFTHALKVEVDFYASYLLSGLITWNFFVQSSSAGSNAILQSTALITKIRLPRVIFPISAVFNNLLNLGFAFGALLIVMAISGAPFHWTLLLTPVMLLPLLIFSLGWAMLVSALSVFFRDIQYILEIGLGALFYITPIIYEAKVIPDQVGWIVSWNPLAKFIHLFRSATYSGSLPPLQTYLIAMLIALAMFAIGWITFQRLQKRFVYWL
jgi:ABC-type polysaccharide/polyol phosphate export permease